jgi:hypothetical protein
MQKITFKDYPDTTTPLNANNLNQMQTNVENAISENTRSIETIKNNITAIENDITSINSDITNLENDATSLENRVKTIENYKGIATYGDGYIDANTTNEPLLLTQIGTPNQSLYFVITLFFSYRTATANRTQIAIPYNFDAVSMKNTVYLRYYFGGSWTAWKLINT